MAQESGGSATVRLNSGLACGQADRHNEWHDAINWLGLAGRRFGHHAGCRTLAGLHTASALQNASAHGRCYSEGAARLEMKRAERSAAGGFIVWRLHWQSGHDRYGSGPHWRILVGYRGLSRSVRALYRGA